MELGILLANVSPDDCRALESMLADSHWVLVVASDLATGVRMLERIEFPVVLCERDGPNQEWQQTVRTLAAARSTACVILLSDVSDPYLWNEVVECGGFDVLPRPLDRERLMAALDFAYTHWKTAWPARVS